ncbi:HigA family addiction module antitoxin [Chimaeribacter californicus]|nr:HigA family addiction module antitoxin [Chimaeribacter californicus]
MMDTITAEPTPVGVMLVEEFLKPLNISQQQLADKMQVPLELICQIIDGSHRITANEAGQLSALFNMSAEFWLNLQATHDRWKASMMISGALDAYDNLVKAVPMLGGNPSKQAYEEALVLAEHLVEHDIDHPLFKIICDKITAYEDSAPEYAEFNARIAELDKLGGYESNPSVKGSSLVKK